MAGSLVGTRVRAAALAVCAVAALAACTPVPGGSVGGQAPTPAGQAPSGEPKGEDGDGGDGAAEPAGGENALSLAGTASGDVEDIAVDCSALASVGAWTLSGTLDGEPVELTFNTNNYDGAGSYNATGVSDAEGGLMGLTVGELPEPSALVASNGDTPGTFTVDDGEATGSVDAVLENVDQSVTVQGTWACD